IQLWQAAYERHRAAFGVDRWPRHYRIWDSGTVDAVSDLGGGVLQITDADKDWLVQVPGEISHDTKRWTNYNDPDAPQIPASYDLIIECDGPYNLDKILHLQITDNDETTLTTSTVADYLTARSIDS